MRTLILPLLLISICAVAQESVKRTDLYDDPSTFQLAQFIVEYPELTASEAKAKVDLWATGVFNNVEAVTTASGDDFVVYNPLFTFYITAMGTPIERKLTIQSKFEFKDARMRVTLVELPSVYTGGPSSHIWPSNAADEMKNKGMNKMNYRSMMEAINQRNKWIDQIKAIPFKNVDDW
jgi:hypothetical protein